MPDEIRRANLGLRECTQQSIALEPTRRKRRSGRPVAELKIIRDHAASLYQVLMTDKAWICTCKAYHLASLRLEARPRTIDDVRANVPQPRGFRVLLSFADGKSHVGTMAQWDEVEIIASLDSCSRPLASGRPCPPTLTPDSDGSRTVGREDTDSAETTWKCIEDICSALCATNRGKREIGLLIDDTPNKQKHRLYRADTFIESQASSKSLEDLLRSRRELGDQGLSRKARLQIAVVLASSVLQLDGTSWLKRDWSSGDIFFHEGTNQLPAAGVGQSQASCRQTSLESRRPTDLTNGMGKYSYPYMSWQRCCQAAVPSQEPLQPPNHMVHSGSLLALGLTLVELCFGRNLMDLRKPQDMNGDETSMRLKTATRLHGLIYDEMGGSYGDVVRRCLFQPFDVREMSLDIEDVQQRVLENVVAPLMEELKNFDTEIRVGIL